MPKLPLQKAIRRHFHAAAAPSLPVALSPLLLVLPAAPAAAQEAKSEAAPLETIVVTGSRIRRVDLETASPVVTIDKAAIEKSGKLTVGDILQEMPAVSGAATNPRVNNGGGTGAATVSLRGLGSNRTLVLVNGRRMITTGPGGADINAIPANLIERIEVLKDGASAVYGSDAIGGVVNFILRENYQGAEFSADYGVSDRDDGERKGYSFTFGHTSDRGNLTGGVNYNQFDAISSGDRDYSKTATYFSSGAVGSVAGSSRTPTGFVSLPSALQGQFGCGSVTLSHGVNGKTGLTDYKCYSGSDAFNYQAVNLVLTPQERTNAFIVGSYKLTESVTAYLDVFHNKTTSNFALAALPFDARSDAVVISKDNYYNPFGTDFGSDGTNSYNIFRSRFTTLGQRRGLFTTATDQVNTGFKGNFGDSSWQWDAGFNYGHFSQLTKIHGYTYYNGLRDALGPSFLDSDGVVKCGSAGNVIAGCVPLNIFNLADPQTIATLSQYAVTPYVNTLRVMRQGELNASGELFELPAGAMSLAVGGAYRKEYQTVDVDYVAQANASGTCFISQEACGSNLVGGFNVKELYAELFVPILKDAPLANSLNLTLGSRHSDYNTFGGTTNSKLGIEWRPIDDLLLRGTVSEVFRAPNISELYAGAAGSAPIFSDPCVGYVSDPAHAAACGAPTGAINIPVGGIQNSGLGQTTGVASGAVAAGYQLKPEHGKSFDYGLVYDPHWIDGLSLNLDYYRITLDDTIVAAGAQTIANLCYASSSSPFCRFIHRFPDGQINFIQVPTVNLGHLETSGVDLGFRYRLPELPFGNFVASLDATYIANFDNQATPDSPVTHVAGHFNRQFGNFARWRALASLNWNLGNWDASWRLNYIGRISVGSGDPAQGDSADACYLVTDPRVCAQGPWTFTPTRLHYGSQTYHNFAVGYSIQPWNTRVEVGVDNAFDKQPPIFYQNNVINSNTDVNTYDTIGRFFFARVSVKF